MLSKRTATTRLSMFALDQVFLALAFFAAFQLKTHWVLPDPELVPTVYSRLYLLTAPVLAMALWMCGFYRLKSEQFPPNRVRIRDMLWGGFVSLAVLIMVGFVFKPIHVDQSQAAPRTPLESPCLGGRTAVSTRSEKTCSGSSLGRD